LYKLHTEQDNKAQRLSGTDSHRCKKTFQKNLKKTLKNVLKNVTKIKKSL